MKTEAISHLLMCACDEYLVSDSVQSY